jgi:N-methylhydantoinase A/oxoprolinase/acetone carboxylase beta subunit
MIRAHCAVNLNVPSGANEKVILDVGEKISEVWESQRENLAEELIRQGFRKENITFREIAYVRFTGQLTDHEVFSPVSSIRNVEDFHALLNAFESVYTSIYPKAALYREAGYTIRELACIAAIPSIKPKIMEMPLSGEKPPETSLKGQREIYHRDRWLMFDIWDMNLLTAGNVLKGPAIIEHPTTTLVVPPERKIFLDKYGIIHYRRV